MTPAKRAVGGWQWSARGGNASSVVTACPADRARAWHENRKGRLMSTTICRMSIAAALLLGALLAISLTPAAQAQELQFRFSA